MKYLFSAVEGKTPEEAKSINSGTGLGKWGLRIQRIWKNRPLSLRPEGYYEKV